MPDTLPFSIEAVIAALLVFAGVAILMGPLIGLLERWRLVDHPNERSSHEKPTLVGGGILVVAALIPAWLWIDSGAVWHLTAAAAGLAALSLADDARRLPTALRFLCHIAAVAAALYLQPGLAGWLPGFVPQPLALVIVGIGWVWFINLFNFMDGIDGITGAETCAIGLGVIAVLTAAGGGDGAISGLALCAVAAATGFLVWNWHPAKIFMGDVGSVPLGFLLGWLLLSLAAQGYWSASLILSLYYLADATITLLRRLVRGEAVWRAHREHFYQKAVIAGRSHAQVTLMVSAANLILIGLAALASVRYPAWSLALAGLITAGLLLFLNRRPSSQIASDA